MQRRKRLKRYDNPHTARFLTFSCQHQLPLFKNRSIADLFVERLQACRAEHEFSLFAFVVMPEHVHLIVRPTRGQSLVPALKGLKLSVGRRVIARWRAPNAPILARLTTETGPRFWLKGGGFDRNIRDDEELTREIRYVHQNPVERGLASQATDWRWSSAQGWLARHRGDPPESFASIDPMPGPASWTAWRGFMDW
ncbi:MAG TPA: transposase [Phycisphaerales bacterium]|nr:transposase [Phycisphaerales bacterium]